MFHRRAAGLERQQARLLSPPAAGALCWAKHDIANAIVAVRVNITALFDMDTPRPVPANAIFVAHLLVLPGVGESNLSNFAADFIVNFAGTFVRFRMDVAAKTQLKCEMDHSNQASPQNYPVSGFLFFVRFDGQPFFSRKTNGQVVMATVYKLVTCYPQSSPFIRISHTP